MQYFVGGTYELKLLKTTVSLIVSMWICLFVGEFLVKAKTVSLTPGVSMDNNQWVIYGRHQSVNTIKVNLNDPYTHIMLGHSEQLNKRMALTTLAKLHTQNRHHVVGAVNAGFFHMNNGKTSYLLSKNNRIVYLGSGSGAEGAFGIMNDKTAKIAPYKVNITAAHNGKSFAVNSYNKNRWAGESVLYTSSFRYGNTATNEFGYEVVVSGLPKAIDNGMEFGETLTGKVTAIRKNGDKKPVSIPANGFVLSANGNKVYDLLPMKIGDEVSISINIDPQWQNSQLILGSGPILVQNGQANKSFLHSSAKTRTARTAVAVDKSGKRVFMATVDSGRKGAREGMTMQEFANYLVSLGAYQAINLDGGGSTTMGARIPGNVYPTLVNIPSGGSQRLVPTILEAVSTAPYSTPSTIVAQQAVKGNVLVGGSSAIQVTKLLDGYNNVLNIAQYPASYRVEGAIGRMEGSNFIAEAAGSGKIVVQSDQAITTIPITVEASPASITSNVSQLSIKPGVSQKMTVTLKGKNGAALIYNNEQVTWTVEGNIGAVSADGTFTAGQKEGKGSIKATVAGKQLVIPVTVITPKPVTVSSMDDVMQWKAQSARAATSIRGLSDQLKKGGKGYIAMDYDFTKHAAAVSASYLMPASKLTVPSTPTSLSLWVSGDGNKNWLRASISDRNGKAHVINFTNEYGLSWKGWRQVTAKIPTGIQYPIRVNSIYVAQGNAKLKGKGTILFDELIATY